MCGLDWPNNEQFNDFYWFSLHKTFVEQIVVAHRTPIILAPGHHSKKKKKTFNEYHVTNDEPIVNYYKRILLALNVSLHTIFRFSVSQFPYSGFIDR